MPDYGESRTRPVNYINISNTIFGSYPVELEHALQKDAIQNAVDAHKNRKEPVSIEFRLIENERGRFLTITDENTVGLSGRDDIKLDEYSELDTNDHWARFESFAFTKSDPNALGARGQGKFIFLQCSENYEMFYETFLESGLRRLGRTQATEIDCPINGPWKDEDLVKYLDDACGLTPMENVGTRIIICKPKNEVWNKILASSFEEAIQETGFRRIEKKQLKVTIASGEDARQVGLPVGYPLMEYKSAESQSWILGQDFSDKEIFVPSTGKAFKIKHFHVTFQPEGVRADLRGLALVQNGMKIVSEEMSIAPRPIRDCITGYIEFDRDLDMELRKGENQHPNHYDLHWRRALPKAIRTFIEKQLDQFASEKLGLGGNPEKEKKERRTNAEEFALKQLQRFVPNLNFGGPKGGTKKDIITPPPPPPPDKDVGLMLRGFDFSDAEIKPRVNWGGSISFEVSAFNKTISDVDARVSIRVLYADSLIETLFDDSLKVLSMEMDAVLGCGLFTVNVDESLYNAKGEYRIKVVLVDREDGAELDARTKKFWVEEDPPFRSPFELQSMDQDDPKRAWRASGYAGDSPILFYNVKHPEFIEAERIGEESKYLMRIVLEGALHFLLTQPSDGDPDFSPLDNEKVLSGKPEDVFDEVTNFLSLIRWEMMESGVG